MYKIRYLAEKTRAQMRLIRQFFIPLHPHLTGGSARTYGSCTANKLHNSNYQNTMYLNSEKKTELFTTYGKGAADTGSAESQIALFTFRIKNLTEHMKQNRKDHSTERALTGLVGKRRALLNYLKKRDINRYRAIVKALGLRK